MMSPQHNLSMNMNNSMNSLPITRHRLMKAKMFKQQELEQHQQQQQQQQPLSLSAVPVPTTPIPIPVFVVTMKSKKSVRFNNCVRVAPFEKVTAIEAPEVWLNSMELAAIRTEGRDMASSYRTLLLEKQQQDQHQQSPKSLLSKYRGFENVTVLRKRQKILANRSAIYAHLQGYKTEELAFIYQQSTRFSTEIAFLQALHDYAEIYTTNTNTNSAANDMTKVLQQQLPSVESCLPPTPLPFAVESAIFFQRQKREQKKNQNKKRTRVSASSASSSRSRSRSRSHSPPLSPPMSPPTSPPPSPSPSMSPIAFEQHVQQQLQYCQQQQQQQQQQVTTVTRRVRQRVY